MLDLAQFLQSYPTTSPAAIRTLHDIIQADKAALAEAFYAYMLADDSASAYLSAATVEARLKPSMARWLETLYCCETAPKLEAALAMQRHVGEVHARAEIPVNIVSRGMRLMKHEIHQRLLASPLSREELVQAVLHVDRLTDIAFEQMSAAFVKSKEQSVRNDEAFRLLAAGQNLSTERERQMGAILEWENRLFRAIAMESPLAELPNLRTSSFGLWLSHKASIIFPEGSDLVAVQDAVARIDDQLLPQLGTAPQRDLVRGITHEVERIKFLVAEMFERLTDLEVGRDTLTQLFNRRFLPSVLKREIDLCRRQDIGFAVLLVDVDHFKRINDQHGHHAGDRILQQVAAQLLHKVRAGDFIFRYGGEEFLIVLAEVDLAQACAIAEKLRERIAGNAFALAAEQQVSVTVSIGVAASDGHPDYEHIIGRADRALYQAKNGGRNRIATAD